VGSVDLYQALAGCSDLLERFGGHAAAAGLTVAEDRVDALRERLGAAVSASEAELDAERSASDSEAALRDAEAGAGDSEIAASGAEPAAGDSEVALIDAEVGLGDVDARLCRELGTLAPFGNGNEEPLLVCRRVRVRQARRVGDGSHLKLEVEDEHGVSRPGIAFGMGARDVGPGAVIDAAFAPKVDTWGGRIRVELEIRGLRAP
jgi:single-stranded-DNA-specific exonuclease